MIKHLLKYIIGLSIILFIFWTRFLRDRNAPSSLHLEHWIFDYLKIVFITLLILYFLWSFIRNLKKILNITKQSKLSTLIQNNTYVIKLQNIIYEYIIDAPNYLYVKFTENKDINVFIEQPASYFTAYLYYPRTLVIMLLMFPRIIVATMFSLSIYYFNSMTYFYYSLNLLIPLLIFTLFVYIVHQYSQRYLDTIETFIDFTEHNGGYILSKIPQERFTNDSYTYEHYNNQFDTICNIWLIYYKIRNYMIDIKYEKDAMSPYVITYTSLCYFIAWSYILLLLV